MCIIVCEYCDEILNFDTVSTHICSVDILKERILLLVKNKNEQEHKLLTIEDDVEKLISTAIDYKSGDTNIKVSMKSLNILLEDSRRLPTSIPIKVDSFLGEWMALHRVLIEASDLLETNFDNEILEGLAEVVTKYKEFTIS